MIDPGIFRSQFRFNIVHAVHAHVINAAGNPIYMLLNGDHHIRQNRGTAWSRNRKQIRKTVCLQAQESTWTSRPFLFQCLIFTASNINTEQTAGHGIEARRKHNDIELIFFAACDQAFFR